MSDTQVTPVTETQPEVLETPTPEVINEAPKGDRRNAGYPWLAKTNFHTTATKIRQRPLRNRHFLTDNNICVGNEIKGTRHETHSIE